jgi:hypothetical protein
MARTAAKRVARRDTASQLEEALADQANIEARRGELGRERQKCLLENDKAGLEKIRAKMAALQLEGEDAAELLALLQAKLADEAAERQTEARRELERRVLARQEKQRDSVVECERLISLLGKEVQKAQGLGEEVFSAWPWQGHRDALPLLCGIHFAGALAVEMYRSSGTVLPGWKSPSVTDPRREIIPSLSSKAEDAIEYAKRIMAETPARAIAIPTTTPTPPTPPKHHSETAPVAVKDAPTIETAPVAPQVAASSIPPGEHAFHVQFVDTETGDEHTETVLFGAAEWARVGADPLGPLGPAGRAVAIEVAQSRVSENYALKPNGIRFDMQRLIATSNED